MQSHNKSKIFPKHSPPKKRPPVQLQEVKPVRSEPNKELKQTFEDFTFIFGLKEGGVK